MTTDEQPPTQDFRAYQAWRRKKVAELARGGWTNGEISRLLGINSQTVAKDLGLAKGGENVAR